jgi:MFS family permease
MAEERGSSSARGGYEEERSGYPKKTTGLSGGLDMPSAGEVRRGFVSVFQNLPDREKVFFRHIAFVSICGFACLALMAPFYPGVAGYKGVSQTWVSVIFAAYGMVAFLTSPIFGKMVGSYGLRQIMFSGALATSLGAIAFGFVYYTDYPKTFIGLSFALRILQGLGFAAFNTAAFAYMVNRFPEHVSILMGWLYGIMALGLALGPAIGGALYHVGGFGLPFWVLGAFMLVESLRMAQVAPSGPVADESRNTSTSYGFFGVLTNFWCFMVLFAVMLASMAFAVFLPTLELHLAGFGIGPGLGGLFFFLNLICYVIYSPVVGVITDKAPNQRIFVMAIGFLGTGLAYLLIGPSPWSRILNSTGATIGGLIIHGIFAAMIIIPSFAVLTALAQHEANYPEGAATSGVLAGLWMSFWSLGEVVGPILSGVLSDNYGFAWTMTGLFIFYVIMGVLFFLFHLVVRGRSRRHDTPMLISAAERKEGYGSTY